MKVLHLTSNQEDGLTIHRMVKSQMTKAELIECYSVEDALTFLTNDGPFYFIIFDADIKGVTAEEFTKEAEEIAGKRATLIVGSSNQVRATVTSRILNDNSMIVIEKPVPLDEFKKAVKHALDWGKKEEFEQSINEFTKDDLHPMKIRNFYLFDQLPYDVYLELTTTKFGKIISKNKPYNHTLIHSYAKKNIKQLYLKKDDFLKFLDQSIKNLLKMYEGKLSERKRYISLHLKTAFFIHQYIKVLNVSDDVNLLTQKYIQSVSQTCRNYENLSTLLHDFPEGQPFSFATQTVYSSYLCHFILQTMGWHADMSKDKLILSCLLQDIALNNEDLIKIRSLNDPQLKLFPEEDQIAFAEHPLNAALVSNYFSGFTEVDFIIAEHHEHPNGDGFPKELNSSSLTTISCIMILAASFTSRLASSARTDNVYLEIYSQMKRIYNTGNFKEPLKALERALKSLG